MTTTTTPHNFVDARTAVFWDTDSCPVPDGLKDTDVSENIKKALLNANYRGGVKILAYGSRTDFSDADIPYTHFTAEKQREKINRIITDILSQIDSLPGSVCVISRNMDVSLSGLLYRLMMRRLYNVIVGAIQESPRDVFRPETNTIWDWGVLSRGGEPLKGFKPSNKKRRRNRHNDQKKKQTQ